MPRKTTTSPKRDSPRNLVLDTMQLTLYIPSKMTDGAAERSLNLLDNYDFLYEIELAVRAVLLKHKETARVTLAIGR